ncbi:transcriptional regulator with XRE-family HTH domain [Sinorhizobium fredii]|uniref:helix-turn-helix domain-containing protein n=1 Tax=Rhizobium fredii TaxID=380 RepID=UPI0035166876
MTPAQLRMARAALKIGVRDLAALAGVTSATITRFENERGGINLATLEKLKSALVEAGIIFLDNGAITPGGPGIRLRDRA